MSKKFRVTSRHAEDLADGRLAEPGEEVEGVDVDDDHNKRLIEEGKLTEIIGSETPASETESQEGGDDS